MELNYVIPPTQEEKTGPSPAAHLSPASQAPMLLDRLRANIGNVLIGKPEVIEMALVTLLARSPREQ